MATQRRCSVCNRTGHDRRAHRNIKGRRLNPDWYRDARGRPHPIRSSPGYEFAFEGMRRGDKTYLRQHSDQPRSGYTQEARGRDRRVAEHRDYRAALSSLSAAERRSLAGSGIRLPRLGYHQRRDVDDARFKPRRRKKGR
jgi:hypothetical protein